MATWIAHMRIAEYFMNGDVNLNNIDFLVGNIAPDCGVPNEDWSKFIPDKKITHWQLSGRGGGSDAEDFKEKYAKKENAGFNFYLGYYFHLLTDNAWKEIILTPEYHEKISKDRNFGWELKKDWYGQDHVYLQNNPDSIFFTMFSKIEEYPNKFLDFFPQDAFSKQIKHITNFYLNAKEDTDREFPYLSKPEMDSFVNKTITDIEKNYKTI